MGVVDRGRWSGSRPPARLWLWLALFSAGCTSVLGLDKDYVAIEEEQGGRGGAGVGASGGTGSTGGNTSGGSGGEGAGDSGDPDSGPCPAGEKRCSGICTPPAPIVGCSLDDCNGCIDVPEFAIPACRDGSCSFDCIEGYVADGGVCEPTTGGSGGGGTGGAGGGGGAGGTGAGGSGGSGGSGGVPCNPQSPSNTCDNCLPFGIFGCCLPSGRCGCTWTPPPVCYPRPPS